MNRVDYNGFIASGEWGLGDIEKNTDLEPRDKEAGCFLPERTDCTAGPRTVIARSGNRL